MNVMHLVAAALASAIWLVVSHPIDVRLGPGDDARVNCAGPSRCISRTQHKYGVNDLHHALEVVHTCVIAAVGGRPAHHLAIVHIRVHVCIICKEPHVDPACNVRVSKSKLWMLEMLTFSSDTVLGSFSNKGNLPLSGVLMR